jgi:molybdate transport system substrate-binding protein
MKRPRISGNFVAPATLTVLILLAACGGSSTTPKRSASPAKAALRGKATVFGAASLTESFNEIGQAFTKRNPDAAITFNFGSSSGLAAQINEQGGADVFASADQANMQKVVDKGLVDGTPQVFIRNRLEIIVAPGNPKGIKGLSDLARNDLKVVLAAPEVPVGKYGAQALEAAKVTVKPVSNAVDVKGVVGPVTLGEADAGIVYASDVKAAGAKAAGVAVPDAQNVTAEYPIALIKGTPNREVGQAFVDFVLSPDGQRILTEHGFISS